MQMLEKNKKYVLTLVIYKQGGEYPPCFIF